MSRYYTALANRTEFESNWTVADAREIISSAFRRLSEKDGYQARSDQEHLALLISDCIEQKSQGVFEAPTGMGKSLAALLPAFAHAIAHKKRIAIATFTNVLAEQYWFQELPLAASLVDQAVKSEFLIGRQRYACLANINDTHPRMRREFIAHALLGIETEFRKTIKRSPKELNRIWDDIAAPVVCSSRLCPFYADCVYYRARRSAEKASIVITNHSVVMQDALLRQVTEGRQSLLGELDFLIIDEAHDFPQAARSALEFELSEKTINGLIALINRMEQTMIPAVAEFGAMHKWGETCEAAREDLRKLQQQIQEWGLRLASGGILKVSPDDLSKTDQVRSAMIAREAPLVQQVATDVSQAIDRLVDAAAAMLRNLSDGDQAADVTTESIYNYMAFLREFSLNCLHLFELRGVAVSHLERQPKSFAVRSECVDISEPLKTLVWDRVPSASLSATLAIDHDFDWYERSSGVSAKYREILQTPFDFRKQSSLYLPSAGKIPDPSYARSDGNLSGYYDALSEELSRIIRAVGGRTLALFHSREEMERVYERISLPECLPILMQRRTGTGSVGEQFKSETNSSLFGLRSFWTGFDAPGATLSCVCLVRIPFEVPADAASVTRYAWLRSQGFDPFVVHSLPMAKMLMRQGAGRLIRRGTDCGIIAILDPRIRAKRYGSEILDNLPSGIRTFDDVYDAIAHVGLESGHELFGV